MTDYLNTEDGTSIAYDRRGTGPTVILIGGAGQFRAVDPRPRADRPARRTRLDGRQLRPAGPGRQRRRAAVHAGRRGGRGAGADRRARGAATLYGSSSGAAIALARRGGAARRGPAAALGGAAGRGERHRRRRVRGRPAQGDRGRRPGATLAYFMQDMPPEWFQGMRQGEHWPLFARMAPTTRRTRRRWPGPSRSRAGSCGGTSPRRPSSCSADEAPPFFRAAADSIVANLPSARQVEAPGSGHSWAPAEMAGALAALLRS